MHQGLMLLGLAGATALGLDAISHLQAASDSPSLPPAQNFADDGRIYLTPEQSTKATSTGLLPRGVLSILDVGKKMKHGDFIWNDKGVPEGEVTVKVDLRRQLLSVFRGGHEVGTSVVLFGAEGNNTPLGSFPILTKIRDHNSSTYNNAPMPFTLRLTGDGVAIHGSDVRWGAATHGCIGVPTKFAELLFEQAEPGDIVEIVSSDARI